MKKVFTLSLLVGAFIFSGCSNKIISVEKVQDHIVSNENSMVKISSPKLNYQGLVNIVKLDNGNIVLRPSHSKYRQIDILKDQICVIKKEKKSFNEDYRQCLPKDQVVKELTTKAYPGNIVNDILNGQPIFDKDHAEETTDGLRQTVLDSNVDILYRVFPKETYFEDRTNNIKVIIER